jgi:hypothetical protein
MGRGFFNRLFGNHVIENVIRQLPCPVFVAGA